ncbi:MAG: signal peptidase II [Actinomycetes bacterium]
MQAKRRTPLEVASRKRFALIAFIVFLVDDATKAIAISVLPNHSVAVLGSLLRLNLRFNSGAAFSFATDKTVFLSAFAVIVAGLVLLYVPRVTNKLWLLTFGLLFGGIVGNLADRIFRAPGFLRGQVVDWIELPHWPTFNVADSSIVIAAVITVYLSARNIKPTAPQQRSGSGE